MREECCRRRLIELTSRLLPCWQEMDKWEHHQTHVMDIDSDEKGCVRRALPHEERFPLCHPYTWISRDKFCSRRPHDETKSSHAVEEQGVAPTLRKPSHARACT